MFNPLFVPPLWIWLTVREDMEHADLEKKGRGTLKFFLFIPVLSPYLLLNCHSSFFPSLVHSALRLFSHTQAVWRCCCERRNLGDHLKPIRVVQQPPKDSVTDGALVFIAGVIGNTHTHSHIHTDCGAWMHFSQDVWGRARPSPSKLWFMLHHSLIAQMCMRLHDPPSPRAKMLWSCLGCVRSSRLPKKIFPVSADQMVWNERINTTISHCGGDEVEITVAVCSWYGSQGQGRTSQLSVRGCQRVKPACENIHTAHLPLVSRHKWLPCGLLINRPVYLLEHNKLATNTDMESKHYKY